MNDFVGPHRTGRKAVRFDTRVPIKYTLKSGMIQDPEVKQGIVTNMSSEGILFETKEQIQPDAEIQAEILLGQNAAVRATGKVIRCSPKQGDKHDIVLTFTQISDTAREEINMWYYSEKFHPNPAAAYALEAERRKSERYHAGRAFVEYRKKMLLGAEPWRQGEIKELSKHGILITTRSYPRENETWELLINLAGYNEPIRAVGRVARVKWEGMTSEVALELTRMKDKDRERLSESYYIKDMVDRADRGLP